MDPIVRATSATLTDPSPIELWGGLCRLPIKVTAPCPKCGRTIERDLSGPSDDGLDDPILNGDNEVYLVCPGTRGKKGVHAAEHEFTTLVFLSLSVKVGGA